jgi:hypothetical protein
VQSNMGLFDFTFGSHERFAGMAAAAPKTGTVPRGVSNILRSWLTSFRTVSTKREFATGTRGCCSIAVIQAIQCVRTHS